MPRITVASESLADVSGTAAARLIPIMASRLADPPRLTEVHMGPVGHTARTHATFYTTFVPRDSDGSDPVHRQRMVALGAAQHRRHGALARARPGGAAGAG